MTADCAVASRDIRCPMCGSKLVVNAVAGSASCRGCEFSVPPAVRHTSAAATSERPVPRLAVACLTGTFLGVLAVPVYVAARAALVVLDAFLKGQGVTLDDAWRFLALVEIIEGVPSIPGWSVAGCLVGLLLASIPDHASRGTRGCAAGAAVGMLAGYLCGVTWYQSAPHVEMIGIGAVLGILASLTLQWRFR